MIRRYYDSGIDLKSDVGHVIVGNVQQTSPDAIYCARHVGLRAGLPIGVPALTVNRLCGPWIVKNVARFPK